MAENGDAGVVEYPPYKHCVAAVDSSVPGMLTSCGSEVVRGQRFCWRHLDRAEWTPTRQ